MIKTTQRYDAINAIIKQRWGQEYSCYIFRVRPDGDYYLKAAPEIKKRNGKRNWVKAKRVQLILSPNQIRRKAMEWEAETGLCYECGGDGIELVGYSVTNGQKVIPCRYCTGTGTRV